MPVCLWHSVKSKVLCCQWDAGQGRNMTVERRLLYLVPKSLLRLMEDEGLVFLFL